MLSEAVKEAIRAAYKRVSEAVPGFVPRPSQRQMIARIGNALASVSETCDKDTPPVNGPLAVVEAPTGTGKTFAYLLAAIPLAQARRKKLIISTATVALQSQLIDRDLPFVLKHAGLHFTFALAKGRGRYACPRKLQEACEEESQTGFFDFRPSADETKTLYQMNDRLKRNQWHGDIDDWPETFPERLWPTITNDKHGCTRSHCDHYNECPFFLSRANLLAVDVVVANHDMVLADLALGGGVILPPPEESIFVFDEAHHLPDKAIRHFQSHCPVQATATFLKTQLDGLINTLASIPSPRARKAATSLQDDLTELQVLLEELYQLLRQQPQLMLLGRTDATWRFENGAVPEALQDLVAPATTFAQRATKTLDSLEQMSDDMAKSDFIDKTIYEQVHAAIGQLAPRIQAMAEVGERFNDAEDDKSIPIARWIRCNELQGKIDFALDASPVWAAGILKHRLWDRVAGAVLTSATLTALGRFDHLLTVAGLHQRPNVECLRLASPFPLQDMVEFVVPAMAHEPQDSDRHTREISQLMPDLLALSPANLVLFASRRQLDAVYESLPEALKKCVKKQGEASKARLIKQHCADIDDGEPSTIFGLASFCEGVDLQGAYCEHVVIAKLDFNVPDDPVLQTLGEWLDERGRSAFMEVSLPECSRRLVQACGRLIRTEADRGRITLLDRRVVSKRYGRLLLDGLPPFRIRIEQRSKDQLPAS